MPAFRAIPEAVQRLILEKIESISELETLLLLHGDPTRPWTGERLSTELRIDPRWASAHLKLLRDRGLLETIGEDGAYRFHAATAELATAVDALAVCYAQRRVAVISLIYSRPGDRIRILADAFRLRKET